MTHKKIFPAILTALTITFLLSACAQTTGDENAQKTDTQEQPETQQLIGGQTDEGGCLIGAGYQWCKSLNKCVRIWEEPCEDFVTAELADVEKSTAIKFSEPVKASFQWKTRKTGGVMDIEIAGRFITAENIDQGTFDKIGKTLLAADFSPDLYNTSSGVNGSGMDGYKKSVTGIVCVVSYTPDRSTQGMTEAQIAKLNRNAKVSCGILPKE